MNGQNEISIPSTKEGTRSNCKSVRAVLLLLFIIYFLASAVAFIGAAIAQTRHLNESLRHSFIRNGFLHSLPAITCLTALVLSIKGNKLADLLVCFAVCLTGFLAFKALLVSLASGFQITFLIEPLIILPSVGFILWKILKAKS